CVSSASSPTFRVSSAVEHGVDDDLRHAEFRRRCRTGSAEVGRDALWIATSNEDVAPSLAIKRSPVGQMRIATSRTYRWALVSSAVRSTAYETADATRPRAADTTSHLFTRRRPVAED